MTMPTANHTTVSGATLPIVALPQSELLTVNAEEMPWLADSLAKCWDFVTTWT